MIFEKRRRIQDGVFFADHAIRYSLPETVVNTLVKELKESKTLFEHLHLFTYYPAVQVEIVDHLLSVDYVNSGFAYIRLDGVNLATVHLPQQQTWNYINEEYSEQFIREGFMLAEGLTFTLETTEESMHYSN